MRPALSGAPATAPHRSLRPRHVVLLFGLAAVWGASFLFLRVASPEVGPFPLVAARVWLAGLTLLVYARVAGRPVRSWSRWRAYLLLGAINAAVPFALFAFATLHLTASLAAVLNATTPLSSAVVAAVWLGEPLGARKLLGLVLGIVGVAVAVNLSPLALEPPVLLAAAAALLAAAAYAAGGAYAKVAFPATPSLELAIGQQLAAGVLLTVPALVTLPATPPTPAAVLSLLGLAILSTALAYVAYFSLLAAIGPTNTLTVTFLIPVFAILWGVLFLHEPLTPGLFAGLALVLLSVALVTGVSPFRRR